MTKVTVAPITSVPGMDAGTGASSNRGIISRVAPHMLPCALAKAGTLFADLA